MHILFGALFFGCLVELVLLLVKPKWSTLGRELPNQKKTIKKLIITTLVFLLLFAVTSGKSNTSTSTKATTNNNAEEVIKKESDTKQGESKEASKSVKENKDKFSISSEQNTNAAVDELILRGKSDSKNATDEDIKTAIKFINDHYNNYWTDNETMHKTMYYGSLLEYAKRDEAKENQKGIDFIIYNLGVDSEQVVKYVYRKADKIEDAATQSNLEQIKKSLAKIPSDYKK